MAAAPQPENIEQKARRMSSSPLTDTQLEAHANAVAELYLKEQTKQGQVKMRIIRKARGTEIPRQAQHVFFCCDAENSSDIEMLKNDLLSQDAGMDCVVSWVDPGGSVDEDELRKELKESQALVLWVTAELLKSCHETDSSGNEKGLPVEFKLAQEVGIPILPIAHDDGLLPIFSELAGKMHGISKIDYEYRSKLKAQLENFLVSDELIKEIGEKAFTAEIFLSYRKIDLEEARAFMKELHDIEGLQGVSIWYDNFLVAGKAFDEEIQKAIENSNAFVLLVTPNITKSNDKGEPNYVVKEEVPYAIKKEKPILPVETESHDQAAFAIAFPNAGEPVPKSALVEAFSKKLGDAVYIKTLDSERAYLLGIAYLHGYNVERDVDRAVKLLEAATEEENEFALRAACRLEVVYQEFIADDVNYEKALHWGIAAVNLCEHIYGPKHPETASAYFRLSLTYLRQSKYEEALELSKKALAIQEKALGKDHLDTAKTLSIVATIYTFLKKYDDALSWNMKALGVQLKEFGEGHSNVAATYDNIARVYQAQGKYEMALEWYFKAMAVEERADGIYNAHIAAIYNNIATVYSAKGNKEEALIWYLKALAIYEKTIGKVNPEISNVYNNTAKTYFAIGKYEEALACFLNVAANREKFSGKMCSDTAVIYSDIAATFNMLGKYNEMLPYARKALAILLACLGDDHAYTKNAWKGMRMLYSGLDIKEKEKETFDYWMVKQMTLEKDLNASQTQNIPEFANTKIGGTIKFGPFTWEILDVQSDRMLIITSDTIGTEAYDGTMRPVLWPECGLRNKLNNDYLDLFSDTEKTRILITDVDDSQDYLFILSEGEALKYFKSDAARLTKLQKQSTSWNIGCWWLRSYFPYSSNPHFGSLVNKDGTVGHSGGNDYDDPCGVRPAMWIKINAG